MSGYNNFTMILCWCRHRVATVLLFNWRESEINQFFLPFFGIANKGAAQNELGFSEITLILIKRCTSSLKNFRIACGIWYAFPWNGLPPYTKSITICGPFCAPNFPWKSLLRVIIFSKACCFVLVRVP